MTDAAYDTQMFDFDNSRSETNRSSSPISRLPDVISRRWKDSSVRSQRDEWRTPSLTRRISNLAVELKPWEPEDHDHYFQGLIEQFHIDDESIFPSTRVEDFDIWRSFSFVDLFEANAAELTTGIKWDAIVGKLERLQDGWAGEGSHAPSKDVIADVSAIATAIQCIKTPPEIEVDLDGSVSLEWGSPDSRAFALNFFGNSKVVGTLSPWSEAYSPWELPAGDEVLIAEKLEDDFLSDFLRNNELP